MKFGKIIGISLVVGAIVVVCGVISNILTIMWVFGPSLPTPQAKSEPETKTVEFEELEAKHEFGFKNNLLWKFVPDKDDNFYLVGYDDNHKPTNKITVATLSEAQRRFDSI